MKEALAELRAMTEAVQEDMEKAIGGNKAAGTRVRKAMQEIKKKAQEIRQGILIVKAGG